MKRETLIVKYMVNNYPFVIARKNWYSNGDELLFVESTTRKNYSTLEGKEKELDEFIEKQSAIFLKKSALAFLIGCQLDMGKPAWKAWRGPYYIAESIGINNFNPKYLSSININSLKKVLREKKLGCRNLSHEKAAEQIKSLCGIILNKYNGRPINIWEKAKCFNDLYKRIDDLPGFGVGLTNMTIKILLELGMVNQIARTKEALKNLQPKPDVHVKRVFSRTGLAQDQKEKTILTAAKTHYPSCPMTLDFAGFSIGRDYCFATDPNCIECPISFKKNGEQLCPQKI